MSLCRLFCEDIDVGVEAGGIRPVVSGLRAFYTLEQLEGKLVVVVCNLKEAKMQGFVSKGMVLAAKSADGSRVEIIEPPAGSEVGELIELKDTARDGKPWDAAKVKKMKVWEAMSAELHTDAAGNACWGEHMLVTSAGSCRSTTITDSPIG